MVSSSPRAQVLVIAGVLNIQGPRLRGEVDIQCRHNSVSGAGKSSVQPNLDSFTITEEEKKHYRGLSVFNFERDNHVARFNV